MEKINDHQSVSNLWDQQTELDWDTSGTDSSTVISRTSQLGFDSSPEVIQDNSGKGNKQPVRRIRKKWTQEENRIVMECYYTSKPKSDGYRRQMHTIWRDKGMININEQMFMDQQNLMRKKQWLTKLELEK